MKTLTANNLIFVFLLSISSIHIHGMSIGNKKNIAVADSQHIIIDLVALGAIKEQNERNALNTPSVAEIMRDHYCNYFKHSISISEDSLRQAIAIPNTLDNDITYEEYQHIQKKKFSGIFCMLLLLFSVIAFYNSTLFRTPGKDESHAIGRMSITRCLMFLSLFLSTGTVITIFALTGSFPVISMSLILLLSLVTLTYIFNYVLERFDKDDYHQETNEEFHRSFISNLKELFGSKSLPFLHYPLITVINVLSFVIPSWIESEMVQLKMELLVLQLLSSVVFLITVAFRVFMPNGISLKKYIGLEEQNQ
ncbi:MAG: hypothetical protein WED33_02130 [Bacteroidia bacterium]